MPLFLPLTPKQHKQPDGDAPGGDAQSHTNPHTHMYIYTQTYIYTRTLLHTHTHIHTHTIKPDGDAPGGHARPHHVPGADAGPRGGRGGMCMGICIIYICMCGWVVGWLGGLIVVDLVGWGLVCG